MPTQLQIDTQKSTCADLNLYIKWWTILLWILESKEQARRSSEILLQLNPRSMNPTSFLFLLYLPFLFLSPNPITGTSPFAEEIGTLSSSSRWIVDQSGRRVKLACANWAAHLEPVVAEGLGKQPVDDIAAAVRSMGFNCVRLTWPVYLATRASISLLTVDESLRHLGLVDSAEGIAVNNPQILNLTLIEAFKVSPNFPNTGRFPHASMRDLRFLPFIFLE